MGGYLNTKQIAQIVGVKPATIRAYRHRGFMPLPVRYLDGRTPLWSADEIQQWHRERLARGVGAKGAGMN